MNLGECPYCNLPGLVTTIRTTPGGLEVTSKCTICGYSCDSEYSDSETADDLAEDSSRPLDVAAAD